MSSVEAGILAGTFVGCIFITVIFAAILFGMFPALACPTCRKQEADPGASGTYEDDYVCCIACEWCCMRYCSCCRPKRLRKLLLEDLDELTKAERAAEEAEQKAKQEREQAEWKAAREKEKEKQEKEKQEHSK